MRLFFCISLILMIKIAQAQKKGQDLIDSVTQSLQAGKEDTNQLKSLGKIAETYLLIDPAKGIEFAQKGLVLAESLNFKKGVARFNNLIGLLVGDTGNNTQARVYFEHSYILNKEIDNAFGMISNLNNIGRSYQRESNYTNALSYFFKALTIAEGIKSDEQISLVGTNLTSSFYAQRNYLKALEYANMTLVYAKIAKTPNNIGKAFLQIGTIKQDIRDTASAKKYLDSAMQVYEEMGNQSALAQTLTQEATLEYPDYKTSIEILLRAQKIFDKIGPATVSSIGNLTSLGETYYDLALNKDSREKEGLLNKARDYLNQAMSYCKETNNIEYQADLYLLLSKILEEKKEYMQALQNFKSYYSINDSLFSQDKKNDLADLEGKHKIELKDNEIAINKLKLVNQQKTLLLLIVGLTLLVIIGTLLIWQNSIRKKSNTTLMILNNQLDEANKIKLKIFGILSHDMRMPVSSLIHYLHLLKNAPDLVSEEEKKSIQHQIAQSTEELLQTLEMTLLWSKEQMEYFKPDIKQIPVQNLFTYLQKFFTHAEPVQISYDNPDNLDVSADENYLQVIMQNLTANAVKSLGNSPEGQISWRARKSAGKTILSITDNGPGIREEQAKSLFEESNVANARSGFGFHLIRDLSSAIHYKISIESKPGKGTTFILASV